MTHLFWQNISELRCPKTGEKISLPDAQNLLGSGGGQNEESSSPSTASPSRRWGHTAVEALNRMFIIGGYQGSYLGDIWMFDFRQLRYCQVDFSSSDSALEANGLPTDPAQASVQIAKKMLERSNHTSVFYKPHNSIYVFGGGHSQKKRFNDTIKIELPYVNGKDKASGKSLFKNEFQANNFLDGSKLAKISYQNVTLQENEQAEAVDFFDKTNEFPLEEEYNDTDSFIEQSDCCYSKPSKWSVNVSKFIKGASDYQQSNEQINQLNLPVARTYHASTLVERFMVIVGGESCSSDLNDLWALDLESEKWYKPEIQGQDCFTHKRFHTANTIQKTKVITFGGCHSEYIHMNELNIFDLSQFVEDPNLNSSNHVICTRVEAGENIPSTRWGHAAAVMNDTKLFVLGGRNDQDVNDMHCFDIEQMKWSKVEIGHPIPKPRRRHSCIFISNCLVMFGGFDGEFFNDLNVMDLHHNSRGIENTYIDPSQINSDYLSLLNNPDEHDFVFKLEYEKEPQAIADSQICSGLLAKTEQIYACKSLMLYRLIEKEMPITKRMKNINSNQHRANNSNQLTQIPEIFDDPCFPEFLREIYCTQKGESISIKIQHEQSYQQHRQRFMIISESRSAIESCIQAFYQLLEYIYCNQFQQQLTINDLVRIHMVAQQLGLKQTSLEIEQKAKFLQQKLQQRVTRDFQTKLYQQQSQEPHLSTQDINLQVLIKRQVQIEISKLKKSMKFDVDCLKTNLDSKSDLKVFQNESRDLIKDIQSPEDEKDRKQTEALQNMKICMNLDEFYDVVFKIDNKLFIKGNSQILKQRSEYFKAMFSASNGFQEVHGKVYQQNSQNRFRLIKIEGVPKLFFNCIIQYIYSDHFYIGQQDIEFFIRLMIYADYFMLSRLQQICSKYIKQFVTCSNVLPVLMIAHAHNANDLEEFCIDYLCLNEQSILQSKQWRQFKKYTQSKSNLFGHFMHRIIEYKSYNFVQHAIEQYIREHSNVAKRHIEPRFDSNKKAEHQLRRGRNEGGQAQNYDLVKEQRQMAFGFGNRSQEQYAGNSSSQSSQSSDESGYTKQAQNEFFDVENDKNSSNINDIDFENLLNAAQYVFVGAPHPLSHYDRSPIEESKSTEKPEDQQQPFDPYHPNKENLFHQQVGQKQSTQNQDFKTKDGPNSAAKQHQISGQVDSNLGSQQSRNSKCPYPSQFQEQVSRPPLRDITRQRASKDRAADHTLPKIKK